MYSEADKIFDIDLADIWLEEKHRYEQRGENRPFYDELYRFLQSFYVRFGQPPFISAEMVATDPSLTAYYQNYVTRLAQGKETLLDFFEREGRFYGMDESCVVQRKEVTEADYQRLFALKLRHYEEDAFYLYPFLDHHLKTSFANDLEGYSEFLEAVLTGQGDLLSTTLQKKVKEWTALSLKVHRQLRRKEPAVGFVEEGLSTALENEMDIKQNEGVKDDQVPSDEKALAETPLEPPPALPAGYQRIEGRFTDAQILQMFSFLYQPVDAQTGGFLTKAEFDQLFAYGLAIPLEALSKKFTLKNLHRYPKRIVSYFIHEFVIRHAPRAKREVLIFFGSYIEDYAQALSPEGLKNLGKNVTGDKPKSNKYLLEDFLPKGLDEVPLHLRRTR